MDNIETLKEEIQLLERKVKLLQEWTELQKLLEENERHTWNPIYIPYPVPQVPYYPKYPPYEPDFYRFTTTSGTGGL